MTDAAHVHVFELSVTFHRAPAGPYPEHTSFMLSVCQCGAYRVFPRANFAICTQAFRARFAAEAFALGCFEVP